MSLVKVVDYEEDNETVNREKIYLVFNDFASQEFREAMMEALVHIIRVEFGEEVKVVRGEETIEFWGSGNQLSRKVTAPEFEVLVAAFNEFFFSKETGLWVKREFLQADEQVRQAAEDLRIEIGEDEEGRVCNVTYHEAKRLVEYLGFQMLSLPEYWQVLREAEEVCDVQMSKHLQSKGFVEFLDTVIVDQTQIIDHPEIKDDDLSAEYSGESRKTEIIPAHPALIYPEEINQETGFPSVIYEAQEKYADKQTWRYWSPDTKMAIATRGYIFLLDKPALDCKIHPDDALPNLGIRVAAKQISYPKVSLETIDGQAVIKVEK